MSGWRDDALCNKSNWATGPVTRHLPHNPEVFFPQRAEGGQCAPAKKICAGCPVKVDCLKKGLREPFGVYGGLSEKERREAHRMFKEGMGLREILAHFEAIEPRRKRKDTLPIETLTDLTLVDLSHLIPQQRRSPQEEELRRAAERRRNGF